MPLLKPLNLYGKSKHLFDLWALGQKEAPPFWHGLKFFNVYGHDESHKGHMASVVYHAYNQIKETGGVKLFKSHNADYGHGEQLRDFVFVNDLADVILWFMNHRKYSGIYNLGTGQAQSFNDLARAVFKAMGVPANINYIDMPEAIRERYQYYTKAEIGKLRGIGYDKPFATLEHGVNEYVKILAK